MKSQESVFGGWASSGRQGLGLAVFLCALGVAATPAKGGEETLRIILRIHDYAGVPSETLADSFVETAKVLHRAGIEVSFLVKGYTSVPRASLGEHWARNAKKLHRAGLQTELVDCSPTASATGEDPICQRTDPGVLVVSILPRHMVPMQGLAPGDMGLAPMEGDDTHFTHAYVFNDLVEDFSKREDVSRSVLLGLVVAHEVGHLLLGVNSHSASGLMRSHWSAPDFSFTSRPRFIFTIQQSERIHAEAQARVESFNVARMAPAARQ